MFAQQVRVEYNKRFRSQPQPQPWRKPKPQLKPQPKPQLQPQLQGSKRWRVWEPDAAVAQVVNPVKDPRNDMLRSKDLVPSLRPHAVEMLAGDVLYIPRGYPHMAETSRDNHSLHLTVTLMDQDVTWEKLLQGLVMTGDAQSWPTSFEIGSRLGASPGFVSLWSEDEAVQKRLRGRFRGCGLKPTARNVSYIDGGWGVPPGGEGPEVAAKDPVTVEGVLLTVLHQLVLQDPALRAAG